MNFVNVIKVSNISNPKLEQYTNSSNGLFITATRSLNYQSKNEAINVVDFTQIDNLLRATLKSKNCLSESEMRYLLYKTIDKIKDEKKSQSYKNSISQLYELFGNLLYSGIEENNLNITLLKETQLQSNLSLFQLYIDYLKVLKKENRIPFHKMYIQCLEDYLAQYEEVSLVGFSFLNDIQTRLYKILVDCDKLANFITNDDFVINDLIIPLLNDSNVKYNVIKEEECQITKFDDLRKNLFNNTPIQQELANDIFFYKPFFTRENEFCFIINQISSILKEATTIEEIEKKCEEIAVVIVSQYAKQTQTFNELFRNQGVFISPEGKVFYSKNEFLESNYKRDLSKTERLSIFGQFRRLEMYEPPKTLFNSILGRFINEIYKISTNGLRLSNFDTLVHINWLFKRTNIDDIISEFNVIKDFFENLDDTNDWKNKILELIYIKKNTKFVGELHNHPLKAIRKDTLNFIKKYIDFLDRVTNKIKNVNGSIKKHIQTLIEAIKVENPDVEIEKELLEEFQSILNSKDESVNIEYQYFAQNFQILINDYISAKERKSNNIRINAINMESANTYQIVFVPMFEENKYPMEYRYEFPYSRSVLEILKNEKLIKNYRLPLNKTQQHSLKLARHIFENLFRIAKSKIIFTRTQNESGMPIDMSIFGYDIQSKFANIQELEIYKDKFEIQLDSVNKCIFQDVKLKDTYVNELLGYFVCPKMFYFANQFEDKDCYTDKFLLKFYCKSLIFNRVIQKVANGQNYNRIMLEKELEKAFETATNEIFNLIPMFDENNKNDIILTSKFQLYNFVEEKIFEGRYKPKNEFRLSLDDELHIKTDEIILHTYKTLVVTDIQTQKKHRFDISRNLDNLIANTGGKQTQKEHYWDIIEELEKSKQLDRANSLNYLSFKINTQLNTDKFRDDGIKRCEETVKVISQRQKGNLAYTQSSYCSYCKFKNICFGGVDYDR